MLAAIAVLASAAALAPTVDRRKVLALPLAVVPVAARAATDDVIVSGTVNAAGAVVGPDAALYVTMRRGGAPQAATSKALSCPPPAPATTRSAVVVSLAASPSPAPLSWNEQLGDRLVHP